MARWSSWFAASLVLALLFVTSDCLRGSNTHIVDQETPIARSRGGSRFSTAKVEKKLETTPEAFTVRSRSNRRGNSVTTRVNDSTTRPGKSLGDTVTHTTSEKSIIQQSSNSNRRRTGFSSRRHSEQSSDLTRAATEDRRYLPEPSSRKFNKQIDDNTDLQVPHESSRTNDHQSNSSLRSRSTVRTAGRRIDTTAPSASGSDVPRSRTGRKIQPTLPPRNFAVSNKYSSSSIASENARGSIESREQSRTTSKRPSRRITERSTERHDVLSNSNRINAATEPQTVTTTASPEGINLPRSRSISDNQNSNKSRGSSSSLRSNRRGVVKATGEREVSQRKLSDDLDSSSKRRELESITTITDTPPRNRGRSLTAGKIATVNKQRSEESSKLIKKSKALDLNNDIGGLSSRTRSRTRFLSTSPNITHRSRINHHSATVKYTMTTDVNSENTTIVFSPSETIETVTNVPVTVTTAPITLSSPPRASKASSNSRKAAASSLSIKTLPKEDFFNHGLGFRGRKFNPNIPQTSSTAIDTRNNEITTAKPHGNPGWTLQRRPSFKKEVSGDISTTVSTISNEIPSSNDEKSSLNNGGRRRGGQTFNKASVILKIDREVDEGDNYPPEFKAKIAELKNSGVKDGGSKSSSGAGKGQKKFTPTRSRQKSSSARRSDSVRISSTSPSSLSVNSAGSVEHTSLRASKRQSSSSRTSTTTPRAIETITLPKVDRKIGRTSTSIERGNVRVGETSHVRQNRKGSLINPSVSDSVTTTVNPAEESSEQLKNQQIKSRSATPRSKNPSNEFTSTTRRSRAWNSAYIDRDWQEPTTVSSTDKNVVLSTTTKRSRVWNLKHIDKNWQEPTKKSESSDKILSTTGRPTLNTKYTRKNISESRIDKTTSSTTEMSELSIAQPRQRDFRPRTATYRRHSEISPVAIPQIQNLENLASVAITPRYHASIKAENVTQRSVRQEPSLALQISNVTMINNSTNSTGISLSSRGKSGNSDSNIFSPTKATFLINSNVSLLEQLRSTVAPLLGVLGAKSPIFSGVYQNLNNSSSNEQRVTPSGSPPRFSARYRGAELLVRKPNVIDSSGLSPTTPLTSIQNENSSSMVSVASPGEPKVLTFYQAFETASIKNEQIQNDNNSQQQQRDQQQPEQSAGAQVDTSSVVTDLNFNGSSNANNDTTTSSTTTTTETILTNLEPVITTVNSLTMVMDSQTPDTSSTQSSDLTQTPDVSTTMPSTNGPVDMILDLKNSQPVNDSSVDNITTPQLIMETLLTTTESISTISTTDMELPTTTDGSTTTKRAMDIIMGDLMETTTAQETSSVMEMTTTSEFMTIGTENTTMEASTIALMTENIQMNVTDQTEVSIGTTPLTTETTTLEMMSVATELVSTSMEPMIIVDDNSNSTETLETLAQFGNSTTSQDTTPSTAQRTAGSDVTTQPSSTISIPSSNPELTTIAQSTITNATTVTQSSSSPTLSPSSPSSTPPSSTTTVMLAAASVTTTAPETTQTESTTAQTTTTQATTVPMMSTSTPSTTTPYLGRFGGSRITPAPRFSSSSSTRMPLRDYHVYGIYPNKTIVRKRPEDNLIDARNIDSPYVIFGIYPDGKLVRKFPNGTVIPDPPSNPVEVVFSLSTSTTTNRPQFPQQYNMFNQGTINNNNQNAASINNRPLDIIFNDGQKNGYRSQLNIGLSGNSLSLNGDGPNQIAAPNLIPGMGNAGSQTSATTMITDVNSMPSQTSGPPSGVTPSSVNPQGGRIIQDIERDKASRTKEAGGQRSTVYIGQEKFINYWSDNGPQNNSQVLSVKINSKTDALNVGPNPGSLPNLDIITNDQDRVTAPPGFPWKDPLDQIFGITTELPIGPSVASNTLDDPSPSRSAITDRTINPLVEVFTPMLNGAQLARDTSSTSSATTNVPSTPSSTIQTTTTTTTTTTSTTTRPTTTTTATTTTTTTLPPQTTAPPTQTTTPVTTATLKPSTTELPFATENLPQQTAFGSTFDDLAFLNSLLQSNHHSNSISSTPKTLTEVEQLLANKILSLALGNQGPTRSPKAIQSSNVSPNSLDGFSSFGNSQPIIIDLLRSTTTKPIVTSTATTQYTWRPIPTTVPTTTSHKPAVDTTSTTTTTTEKNEIITEPTTISTSTTESMKLTTQLSTTTTVQSTWKPLSTNPPTTNPPQIITSIQTTQKPLNRKPVTVKPTQRPRPITTTQQPLGFGAGLLQAIFGRNIFAPPPTQRPLSNTRRPVATTKKIVQTTVKPISTTRAVESKVTTVKSTSTFSPEDDAKFLLQLLNAANKNGKEEGNKGGSSAITLDDEKFLRAILSGEAKVRTPAPSTNNAVTLSNAALLAELLKAEGIEPTTPINRLREQLQASGTAKPSVSTDRPRTVETTPRKLVTTRPRTNERTSTYPPPLFSNFNFGLPRGQITSEETSNDSASTRNQVLNAAIGATRLFSQFLGSAITGAAQQLQSFVRNGTRYVSEVVG